MLVNYHQKATAANDAPALGRGSTSARISRKDILGAVTRFPVLLVVALASKKTIDILFPRLSEFDDDRGTAVLFAIVAAIYVTIARHTRMGLVERANFHSAGRQRAETDKAGLAAAIEQAANGIIITDRKAVIQYVNPAFTRMTGYSQDEAVGQNPRFLKSGRQDAAFYKNLWRTIAKGEVWHGELINRRKNGSFYIEQMTIAPVRDAHGATTNFIAIKQDVTERKAADNAQRFLASIVESSEEAIIGQTPDGIIMSWNRGAELLHGYTAAEVIGKHVSMLVWPGRHEVLRQVTETIKRGEMIPPFEGVAVHKNGRKIDISLSLCPIQDADGRVVARAAVIRDITARKQAEEARALLASIVHSSDDAIYSSSNGMITTWNRGAEEMFGYEPGEIIGKPVTNLAPPHLQGEWEEKFERSKRGEKVSHF